MKAVDRWLAELETRIPIVEQPFRSRLPVIGGLIVWVRTRWNNIATRWYVLPMLQQQNEINGLWLAAFKEHTQAVNAQLEALEQDQMAAMEYLAQLGYRLARLEERLTQLEQGAMSSREER